ITYRGSWSAVLTSGRRPRRAGGPSGPELPGRAQPGPEGWSPPARMCYSSLMRAYLAQVTPSALRRFLPEDLIPEHLRRRLIREWSSAVTIVLGAVLDEEDAEAVREELIAGRPGEACAVLLERAVEVHPTVSEVVEFGLQIDDEPRGDAAP